MSFFGSLFGTDASAAANAAAADTYRKQKKATDSLISYGNTLPGQYNAIAGAYQPYTQAGNSALQRLMGGLGLGSQEDGQAFTAAYRNLPGYQAGLDTGLTGAQRALNAGNMSQSGAALKNLYRFGSDYEDQRSGDYLTRLAGLQNQGLAATGAAAGLQAQGVGANTGIRQTAYGGQMNSAGTIGQGMVAGAQAEQNAMQNLLGTAAYLGGSFLGGPMGGAIGRGLFSGGGINQGAPGGGYYGTGGALYPGPGRY